VSGSSELQDPVALGATGSCHVRAGVHAPPAAPEGRIGARRYDGHMTGPRPRPSPTNRFAPRPAYRLAVARVLGLGLAASLLVAACSPAEPTSKPSEASTSVASVAPSAATSSPPSTSSSAPQAGQTDTDWGRIWDSLPAAFPVYPGATPAEATETGPVSAAFALNGQEAKTVATWMQMELERATYSTEALTGPLEDGSFVLDSTGPGGCRIEVAVAPLGSLTTVTVRYGAACPSP
jgi:hypothetical protein